jgi:AraC-like DNA-binding protein
LILGPVALAVTIGLLDVWGARTTGGRRDIELVHELEEQIALILEANNALQAGHPRVKVGVAFSDIVVLDKLFVNTAGAHLRQRIVETAQERAQTNILGDGSTLPDRVWKTNPGVEIDMVSQPGYGAATASFPLELVKETADRFGRAWISNMPTSLLIGLTHDKTDVLRATFNALLHEAVGRPFDGLAETWAINKQEDLLRILLQCLPGTSSSAEPSCSGERARVLKAALAAINDTPEDILTIGDLCRIGRASERTLHYAFTEHFGLPPAQFMKAHRLNGARNDLRREHELSMKIADVANKWGFWHLGQFCVGTNTLRSLRVPCA